MDYRQRLIRWFFIAVAAGGILLIGLAILVPRLIRTEALRAKIETEASRTIGGAVTLESVELVLLGLPHVKVRQPRFEIPGTGSGTLESLELYPSLLPLIVGKFQISRLYLDHPRIDLEIPGAKPAGSPNPEPLSIDSIRQRVGGGLLHLKSVMPDLVLRITGGELSLSRAGREEWVFGDIDALVRTGDMTLSLSTASRYWESLTLQYRFLPGKLTGEGKISVFQFRPHLLVNRFLPDPPIRIDDSRVNLTLLLESTAPDRVAAKFSGSFPRLTLVRGDRRVTVNGKRFAGALSLGPAGAAVRIEEAILLNPRLTLTGTSEWTRARNRLKIDLTGTEMDIASIRNAALSLGDGVPEIGEIFSILKGGVLPSLNFRTAGAVSEIGALSTLSFQGTLAAGQVHVPGVDLDLEDVSGEVLISGGRLEGKHLAGRLGNTLAREGTLQLGLEKVDPVFGLDVRLAVDVSELPGYLRRLVESDGLNRALDRIETIGGRADGRLVLGDRLDRVRARVAVSSLRVSAGFGELPAPVEIEKGMLIYEETGLSVEGVDIRFRNSTLKGISGRIDWAEAVMATIDGGAGDIDLKEIGALVSTLENPPKPLKEIHVDGGRLIISAIGMTGPLFDPRQWEFSASGALDTLLIEADPLPGSLRIPGLQFRAGPREISIQGARAALLDTSLEIDGTVAGLFPEPDRFDLSMRGTVGPRVNQWILETFSLPPDLNLRPHRIADARVSWSRGGGIGISMNLDLENGPHLSTEVNWRPGHLDLKHLRIKDGSSDARIRLQAGGGKAAMEFSGRLTRKTVDRLVTGNRILTGQVTGDFKTRVDRSAPMDSSFAGTLQAEGVTIPFKDLPDLSIRHLSVKGGSRQLTIPTAEIEWAETRLDLDGQVGLAPDAFVVDLNAASDRIDAKRLSAVFAEAGDGEPKEPGPAGWALPLRGKADLRASTFVYEDYVWKPLHATISFMETGIDLDVTEANLCGISTPGTIRYAPGEIGLSFQTANESLSLDETLGCLFKRPGRIHGNFNLAADISGKGTAASLPDALGGKISFASRNGRISGGGTFNVLRKVLELVNVTEIFFGKAKDARNSDFIYNSITVSAAIERRHLKMEEIVIDGALMKITGEGEVDLRRRNLDLTVLVSPLKTVDRVVEKLPIFNQVLGGTLISIPVRIKGSLDDPEVTALSPSDIGEGLLGITRRALQLPFSIIQPGTPEKNNLHRGP